jgi:hypothetical protein
MFISMRTLSLCEAGLLQNNTKLVALLDTFYLSNVKPLFIVAPSENRSHPTLR